MAIDVAEPLSPGWWMARLSRQLLFRYKRLEMLDLYMRGEPRVELGAQHMKDAYSQFMRKARSNFAELVVEAVRERMAVRGFRTAAESDDIGDDSAWAIWKANALDIESAQVHEHMLSMGDAYAIVGFDSETKRPIITGEDPRQVITQSDPTNPQKIIAALKLFHDDVNDTDLAYLYLPGVVYVAGRQRKARINPNDGSYVGPGISFSAAGWSWLDSALIPLEAMAIAENSAFDELVAQPLPDTAKDIVPVVRFPNKRERGEFEGHIDLLDRINHTILQRMVIATFQAFKQRAIKGELPDTDEAGDPIDYEKIFTADPGAIWQIPAAVEMWESGQVELSGIISAVKADVEHLASVTRTPMHYLTPGDAAQSAEGASLAREGLVFKTKDRISRAAVGWTQVMYLAYLFSGDAERADLGTLQPMWDPIERYSLAEMANASAQATTALPWETLMERVWQLSPEELQRAKTQRSADMVVAQVAAANAAASAPPPPPIINEPPVN